MKLKEQIFKRNSEDLHSCEIYYDEHLTKGLYVVGNDNYIKRNVKALEIEYQIPDNKYQIGIKFSKQYEFVVLTAVMFDENMRKQKIQFIIKDNCTEENIHNCNHYILDGFKESLINGLKMLKIQTLEDMKNWEPTK